MNVWHKPYPYSTSDDVIVKRHECEWVITTAVAKHLKYNPRHLPVVREITDEDILLRLSIERILRGYRVFRTALPASPFTGEEQ